MENAKFKIKAEENPKLLKAINPIINPAIEIKKVDEKLEILRVKIMNVEINRPDKDKLRIEIDELLDKRLEWMKMIKKKVIRLIKKRK